MSHQVSIMQFFGGPLDGHSVVVAPLPPTVVTFDTVLVRPQLSPLRRVAQWLKLNFDNRKEVTIVATYRLDRRGGRCGYVHTGSRHQKDACPEAALEHHSAEMR